MSVTKRIRALVGDGPCPCAAPGPSLAPAAA